MPYQLLAEPTDVVTEAFAREFALRFVAAWNSHDPDQLAALATEDVLWEDPYIAPDGRAHGKEAVRAWLRSIWRAFPDLAFRPLDADPEDPSPGLYLSGDRRRVAAPWHGRGRMTGPLTPPGFAPTGGQVDQFGVDLWAFRGGLVCHVRTFTDVLDVALQIGAAPRPGSLADRIGVLSQRLAAGWERLSARRRRSRS